MSKALFSPIVTGCALLVLLKGPESIREPLLRYLHQNIRPHNVARLISALKWLFGLGVVTNASSQLNAWAGNNFHLSSDKTGWVWDKEIAIVTGGSSGFGTLFTKDLTEKGVHVVVLDVNPLPASLESNPKVTFFKCDVTNPEEVNHVAQTIQSSVGHPSILINNAGIGRGEAMIDTDPAFLQKIFGVNVFAHYYTIKAFLPNMIAQKKGHIITIASMASFLPTSGIVHYSMTKSSALAFHEGLSTELRTVHKCPQIKTTVVHSAFADTPLIAAGIDEIKKSGMTILDPQDVSDAVVKQILDVRGGPLYISKGADGFARTMRKFPYWLQEAIKRMVIERDSTNLLSLESAKPGRVVS